ncbi:D-alanyl-D-alanine carboxypeptidase family protein [aff. Roholtiella sp. LEGE 12411]|uniref:D-alanyl-D-alanine carboxypeptidase family protein n=1 Tax=aff. Roholtiella sp. LEGE 12411 TaxID=1828822 RepID=UPI0018824609|nr:D-alanyl-D-alanine carboxypeptidase family protein [aff. Roholtiella sp. LEGE 12411]MBE9036165.1 D-alanyl-D-alanine carboxypeptidase family protein [aff. Roholtiella sp. LEGE 12411]
MKRIFKKMTFITIFVLMIFSLVASHEISHHQLDGDTQSLKKCLNTISLVCTNTISIAPFIPNQQLNDQERFLSAIARKLPIIPQPGTFEYILLRAYGAVFVNPDTEIKLPQKDIFANEQETQKFQDTLSMGQVDDTNDCYLQKSAANALNKARVLQNIPLKSGYGSGDCTRNFATNLRFWHKYANNQILARVQQGKETKILGLVAPPGTSQHLWGLAIDLRISNQRQKQALNENGWFQTVENDIPHWTYVGLSEEYLPQFGFKNKVIRGISYWITPL